MTEKKKEIDDFILFLDENKFDSGNVTTYMKRFRFAKMLRVIFGILLIAGGVLVIVLPMPGYIEIATIFYFTPEDGIAVSDIIALGVMLLGIVLVVKDKIYYASIIE